MTNKQIIIDNIDVSGCEFYRDDNGVFAPDRTAERTEICYLTNDYCGNSPNCHYKNWQRKEQILIEIKEIAEGFCNACKEFEPHKCKENNRIYCNYNKILQKISEVKL